MAQVAGIGPWLADRRDRATAGHGGQQRGAG
jgi:hypothetical protein